MDRGVIRILEFTKSFHLGGTEGQLLQLLRGLPAGYEIHVAVIDLQGPLSNALEQLGHRPAVFPLNGSLAHPNTAFQVARLARWLRANRIELVHVHDFYATMLAVPAARLALAKVVVGRLDLAHWHSDAQRKALRAMTRLADHVVVNAQAIRNMLIEQEGIAPSAISLIRNGIDLRLFDCQAEKGLSGPIPDETQPAAVLVANMNHPVKRQEDFLRALQMIATAGGHLRGWLVGDGPRRPQLEKLADALGLSGRVHFLGHRTDVPAIYARASMGVLCSNAEGLSNAIIEGMAAWLPMVVTDAGGNSELISHGKRGLLVPPERPSDLASAMFWMLRNRIAARQMGEAARAYVERKLSAERLASSHDLLYRSLVRPGQRGLAL